MTVHPPISWDIWPFKHVVAAALALVPEDTRANLTNPWLRDTDLVRVRMKVVGAIRTYAGGRCSWPEIARALGSRHHSSAHDQYKRWLLLERAEREAWLFKVLVELNRRERRCAG